MKWLVLSDSEGYTVQYPHRRRQGSATLRACTCRNVPRNRQRIAAPTKPSYDNGIARWQSGAPGSDQFFSGGSVVESLTANGITVQVSLQDTGWKLRASVAIANDSVADNPLQPRRIHAGRVEAATPRARLSESPRTRQGDDPPDLLDQLERHRSRLGHLHERRL